MLLPTFHSFVRHGVLRIGAITWFVSSAGLAMAADEGLEFFEKKIRPVLVERCYKCHSSETAKPKGGLRLDRQANVLQGGE